MADEQYIPLSVLRSYSPHPDKLDLTGLTQDEITHGIKSSKLPDYIRYKQYLTDTNEALAQLAEMIIQFAVNLGLDPDQTLDWARKLQQALPQSEFDSWVATLLDGGPSIFMNTLSELQTTYPNGAAGVALVRETDPAKIYVWNGTAWEDFGDYQGIEIKDGAVTTEKISADKLTPTVIKDVQLETGYNLFVKDDIRTGGYYHYQTGAWVTDANYISSGVIPVVVGETYKDNKSYNWTFWGLSGNYISGQAGVNEAKITNTSIRYVRLALLAPNLENEVFTLKSLFNEAYYGFDKNFILKGSNLQDVEVIQAKSNNLFDASTVENDVFYNYQTGVKTSDTTMASSAPIPIEVGHTYRDTKSYNWSFWDKDLKFVSGQAGVKEVTITNPVIKFTRVALPKVSVSTEIVGDVADFPIRYTPHLVDGYKLNDKWKLETSNIEGIEEYVQSKLKTSNIGDIEEYIQSKLATQNAMTFAQSIEYRANGKPLVIPTYDGSGQAVHPKVLYFENGWNGFRYWMAMTPYRDTNDYYENPSILCSNDSYNWHEPSGISNPISGGITGGAHYSDTHLVMVGDTMECWYRYNPSRPDNVSPNNDVNYVYRQTSTDGVAWSEKELIFESQTGTIPYVSPSVIYENGKYRVWHHDYNGRTYYQESSDLVDWTSRVTCTLNIPNASTTKYAWHSDIIHENGIYEMVVSVRDRSFSDEYYSLFYMISKDGINFDKATEIIKPTLGSGRLDDESIYRASILKVDGAYKIYYSADSTNRQWHIFLSEGTSPYTLVGSV